MTTAELSRSKGSWLLLVHQLPPKPAYLRVKIWRRLQAIGAIALKNAIYAIPRSERTGKDFGLLLRDIERGGGEGVICEAGFVQGLSDRQVQGMFNAARDADYHALAKDLRKRAARRRKNRFGELNLELKKARQQLSRIMEIDFFNAAGREAVESLLAQLEHSPILKTEIRNTRPVDLPSLVGRIWVTRQGVHIDRVACAWLIRRFIDPKARFKFVPNKTYRHASGEIRFDMANAEFTHEDDKCSFEVLLAGMHSTDRALMAIGEIVHNLDLKDRKFDRPETSGIGHIIEGICTAQNDDLERIARGSAVFDDVYERFCQDR